jgi:hypothetical protein
VDVVKIISHRGNINGPRRELENKPRYINQALELGYDVEIDVWWKDDGFWLGHDEPQFKVNRQFLQNDKFWCHAKNIEGYKMLDNNNIHCFFHQEDDVTLTSKGYIWTYPNKQLTDNSIAVLPKELDKSLNCYGVCTDFVTRWI